MQYIVLNTASLETSMGQETVPSPESQTTRARKGGNRACVPPLPVHLTECISFSLRDSEGVLMAGPMGHTSLS